VEPSFRGHPQDQEKCPLKRDVPSIEETAKCKDAKEKMPGKVSPEWRCPLNRDNCKVEPPFRGHPQDQEKCPQNGAVSSYRGDCKVQTSIQGTPSEPRNVATNVA